MNNLLEHDPSIVLCFSGHRPDRLPGKGDPDAPEMQKLIEALRQELIAAVKRGKTVMIHGCMAGFDIVAAEQVITLKTQFPYIRLVSIAPYKAEFFSREKCWTPNWIYRAKEVFKHHDIGVKIAERYRSGIYYERNDALIKYSSELICYWDGRKSGTKYTIDRAEDNGLTIYNLFKK